jgi:hypothetical protein
MAYLVTFMLRGKVLVKYGVDSATDDELKSLPEEAHEEFRKEFPDISLFDGVTVFYDKSS